MYDLIIIGAGPAGLTAGIYAQRAGLKTLILEKEGVGGQIASSYKVENYPGFTSISGADLANNFFEQAINEGCDFEIDEAKEIKLGHTKKVICEYNTYESKALIIATGAKYRVLGLENEDKFIGNGIHFCTTCDGAFYKDKTVAVVGGGNTGITNAMYLSSICKKVYLITLGENLKAENVLNEKIKSVKNVEILYDSFVSALPEDEFNYIKVNTKGKEKTLNVDGMFLSIGFVPNTSLFKDILSCDERGYAQTLECKTVEKGVFIAGDVRKKEIRQVTTAVSDGTLCAMYAANYVKNWENENE